MRHFQHLLILLAAWGGGTLGPLAQGSYWPEGQSGWNSTDDTLYFDGEVVPWPSTEGHIPVAQALDVHPELKSRARLWADLDGSFLVDPHNAAEMRDFITTVIRGAIYDHEWSGSYDPFDPGTVSPVWRQREYAQVNAYRAIVGLSALEENPRWLPILQAGAAFLNQDGVVLQHRPPPDAGPNWSILAWFGTGANLAGGSDPTARPDHNERDTDGLIDDGAPSNKTFVGHRTSILKPNATSVTLGYAARGGTRGDWGTAALRVRNDSPFTPTDDHREVKFIKWPSDGYFPMDLLNAGGRGGTSDSYRWSFWVNQSQDGPFPWSPGDDPATLAHATVSATVNGSPVAIGDLREPGFGEIVTWDIANRDLGIDDSIWPIVYPDDVHTAVVTIANIQYQGEPLPLHTYTVKFAPPAFEVPEPLPTPTGSFANLSTRGRIGRGDQSLIAGLIVKGEAPVKVVFRAQGPGLTQYDVTDPARDLRMELFQKVSDIHSQSLGSNQGWREGAHWRLIDSYETLAPSDDREPALAATLWPGLYTVVVTAGQEGVGIVEAFNVDGHSPATFGNLSTRGLVGSGESQMIAGIVLTRPTRVLIRAQGPSLAAHGVTDALADPILQLRQGTEVLAENRHWQDDPGNAELTEGGPLAIYAPGDAREAALVKRLPAGVYTAQVSTGGEPGVGIVEVFALD